MQGILFAEKPRARQLYLDARTKIILCLTVSFLMFSCEYTGVMRFVLPVLAAVPFVSFLILRRYRKAAVYGMVYQLRQQRHHPVFQHLQRMLQASDTPQPQSIPNHSVFLTDCRKETKHDGDRNGELFGDVKAVHGSDKLADRGGREQHIKHGESRKHLREDRRQRTGDDTENRRVQLAKEHRKHKAEHMQVGNELSASAMTRGLDTPGKRSNVCPMGFRVQDIAVFLLCVAVVSLFIFAKVTGR